LPNRQEAYAVEHMLDDISCVADACDVEHFLLWGHSFGGSQALQLTVRSQRITRAVVAGSFFGQVYREERVQKIIGGLEEVNSALKKGQFEYLELTPEELAWFEQRNIPAMIACWQALISWPIVEPREVQCSLFLYTGSADERVTTPLLERQKEIEAAGIVLHTFDHLDHEQEISEIEIVFPTVLGFLQGTSLSE
ncbi:MAG TPA: alpha/beta hydrolase, partial [Ktedonobacteraceae bacterium]|nr:alpha/beta hydrolase [Ktedonobacteraceae bacterium]